MYLSILHYNLCIKIRHPEHLALHIKITIKNAINLKPAVWTWTSPKKKPTTHKINSRSSSRRSFLIPFLITPLKIKSSAIALISKCTK